MSLPAKHISSPLEHAAKLRTRDRIVALGEALSCAGADQRDSIAYMLIELAGREQHSAAQPEHEQQAAGPVELIARLPGRWRSRHADEALMALARGWSNLSPGVRPLAVALGRDRWLGAVRELARHPRLEARLTAVAIAYDTADPGLSKVVASLLSDEEQRVRRACDETLLRMALKLLDHLSPELLGASYSKIARTPHLALPADPAVLALERCTLYSAIADAAWSFASHRCRSPLIAALLLMDRAVATPLEREVGSRMRRLLSQRNHPSHAPLRSVLKRTDCPLLRERALRWLTISSISTAALDRLCVAETRTEHEIVLRRAHLAMRPARSSKLGTLGRARTNASGSMLPARSEWDTLSEASRLGLMAWSAIIGESEGEQRVRLEPALADASCAVRFAGAALCPMLDLQDYLFDTDARVARHAALRWSTTGAGAPRPDSPAGGARLRLSVQNTRSPHAFVRRLASEERARLTIDDPHEPASRLQARRLMQADPAGFARMVRDRLSNPATRNDMITLIRMLGVERRFELDLIGIVQDERGDDRARASAVAALGRVDSNAARYTMSESLGDRDPRTRSNAIETVPLGAQRLLEFKDDQHHRVRASAVYRAINQSVAQPGGEHARAACAALIEMLGDARPSHRLAGTWAAQRTLASRTRSAVGHSWGPIVSRLEELAANDEDPRLRERAGSCINRLTRELRLGSPSRVARSDSGSWE
ncbi:MAG: hypothetical protein ACF8MF_01080 [Phycisphaerales bacterium JB052]